MKQVSRAQQAEAEFRKGIALMQQGRGNDAVASYQAALQLDSGHDAARQALVAQLLDEKRGSDAERLLQERLDAKPDHIGFAMLRARLQVERGATGEAQVTLERSLPFGETKADYLAFLAALQQRNNFHAEAVAHYRSALQLQPGNGAWLMGCGISLQALRRNEEAKVTYQQALDSKTLSPELRAFVQRKLKAL
jgi:MSHA biogenesis protein MshN